MNLYILSSPYKAQAADLRGNLALQQVGYSLLTPHLITLRSKVYFSILKSIKVRK